MFNLVNSLQLTVLVIRAILQKHILRKFISNGTRDMITSLSILFPSSQNCHY